MRTVILTPFILIGMSKGSLLINRYPIKNIKIGMVIKAIIHTKSIIAFSKTLNIKTIAEYVHSEEIFNLLLELGVDEFQGYYFGKPDEIFS